MWLKMCFLLLYFILLFLLARIFEAVVWYETGMFSTQLVDPVTLSYHKLKTILDCRGLAYSGLAEKKDVSQLVHKSGELTQGELYSAIKKRKEQTEAGDSSSTYFSGEMHFYELVEDTKDGIWLVQVKTLMMSSETRGDECVQCDPHGRCKCMNTDVSPPPQVIAQDREALLSQSSWGKMVQKVSQFGIRTGTFNCSHDHRSCDRRGWRRSTLIMSVPQTSASKGGVMLKEYDGRRIEAEHIFRWMTSHVAHRIKMLRRSEQLAEEWRCDNERPVKMFLFAHLSQPPAFFSSLSVKFTGRIEFIYVDVRHWDNQSSLSDVGVTRSPAYILKMPEGIYHYGNSTGEFLSSAAMDTFLRSVQPEVNDLFVLSLVLINLMAWMDLFITQGATVKRFVVLIRTLGTYNSILLLSWLPVLALLQLPHLDHLSGFSLKLLRYADTTALAGLVRADWTFYSSHPALFLSTYLAHGLLVDYFEKKRRCGRSQDSSTNLEWLASLWDWYASYLLHPITALQQVPSDQSDWEDDPGFLLEHLAFPDLWLRPLVNMDYIKALPTWTLGVGSEPRGEGPDEETDSKHADPAPHARRRPTCSCDDADAPATAHVCCHGNRSPTHNHVHCDEPAWPRNVLRCSECVVCLEMFVSEELLMGLPCGHAFHQQCIMVWLAAGKHCCPVCRWPSYKKKPQNVQSAEQD